MPPFTVPTFQAELQQKSGGRACNFFDNHFFVVTFTDWWGDYDKKMIVKKIFSLISGFIFIDSVVW
ncbi:hypothetical protein LF1_18170 [Rubripirellula obstinata]|uniref:Uncharacterized protein n=1 Tax=Rubripirellula obstinata TaxID=406547 RepID=A0A5B1CDQ5_9BACT|nr:hypothetical protein LF1_18170 [Rubripirellula obstinata]